MERIKKIEKFCTQEGYHLKYQHCQFKEHIGGRSFNNDWHYMIDIYELSINGKEFELHVKTTGRALYWLFSNSQIIVVAFNQSDFLKYIIKNKDIRDNRIF